VFVEMLESRSNLLCVGLVCAAATMAGVLTLIVPTTQAAPHAISSRIRPLASPTTTRHHASGNCYPSQMRSIRPPYGSPNPSTTLGSEAWFVQLAYRNSGHSCTLVFPHMVRLTNRAGRSARARMQPISTYQVLDHARVFITLGMSWERGTGGVRRCPTVLRNVKSASLLAGKVKLSFPVTPAFAGVCRKDGASLLVSSTSLIG
jgi:hypothetical protein